MRELVTAAQMRALDAQTIDGLGVPGAVLMESAGRCVVDRLWSLHRDGAVDLLGGQVLVVAGPGNNGGDGLVVARTLHPRGVRLQVLLLAERDRLRGDAALQLRLAEAAGVHVHVCPGEAGAQEVAAAARGLGQRDVIVDALFGTGLTRALRGPARQAVLAMNSSAAVRVAVDLPSGLDADRGEPASDPDAPEPGDPAIVQAAHTVTFAFPKLGLVGDPGFLYAGQIAVADIGIPRTLAARHGIRAGLLDASCLRDVLRPRPPTGHKGSHGHLLILAGSAGKTGAALLCAEAAQAVGVGLCTIASPPAAQQALQARVREVMTAAYGHQPTADGLLDELRGLTPGKRALAVGPGLPTDLPGLAQALLTLLTEGDAPAVLDADGLNLLAPRAAELQTVRRPLVLTPHPGEAARLLGRTTADIARDRVDSARALCQRTGAVAVLKGARTVIAAPDGALAICPTGNAGMGTGGMGDVLTGIIGALLTRGLPAYQAACAGVYWHGLAGDLLARAAPPGSLLLAGDVRRALPAALQHAAADLARPADGLLHLL